MPGSPRHSALASVGPLLPRSGATGLADLLHGQVVGFGRLSCGFTPRRRLLPLCFVGPAPLAHLGSPELWPRRSGVALVARAGPSLDSVERLSPRSGVALLAPWASPSVRSGSFRFAPASRLSQLAQLTCAPSASPWRRVHGSPWLPASTCRAGHCIACPDGHCASGSPRPRLDFGLGLVVLSLHRSGAAGLTYPGALTSPPLELVPWCCVSAVVGASPRRASS